MPLRTEPEALEEIDEAAACYGQFDWRKAAQVVAAYDAAVARIAADPTSLPLHHFAVGPAAGYVPLRGFPYLVLFRTADPAETVVLAVVHTAAGPGSYRRAERRG